MKSKVHDSQLSVPAALEKLATAACGDLTVARLTLGLIDSFCGLESMGLFPGYNWSPADVFRLPQNLVPYARTLLSAARPGLVLNGFFVSRIKIAGAVHAMRRNSPFGKRRAAIARQWRRKYPQLKPAPSRSGGDQTVLRTVDILADEIGRPLGPYTLRLVGGFKPSRIEILAHREPEYRASIPGHVKIRLAEDGFTITGIEYTLEVEPAVRTRVLHGVLDDYFETGTEGVIWSLSDDDARGYDGLYPIDAGDHLTIRDQLGRKLWSGRIKCDRKSGWRRYPSNPKLGQPCALGHWVHWTQRGFKPDDWARFFIRPEYDRMRAVLRKSRVTDENTPRR